MKGTSIMWDYIREEKDVLMQMLDDRVMSDTAASLPEVDAVYIVAHGSSFNAAVVMTDFLSRYMNARVYGYLPANFIHSCHSLQREDKKRCMVVAISQTGTSRGLLEAAAHAKESGFAIMGITQAADSPISRLADRCLYLGCQREDSNAKTKGYSSTLIALMIMGIQYSLKHGIMGRTEYEDVMKELKLCVEQLDYTMDRVVDWCSRYGHDWQMKDFYVLGTGMNYGTAMEGQLKLMETMCIPTMFNDLEEFSHGMHRAIGRDSSVLLLCADGPYKELAKGTFSYLLSMTEQVLMLYAGNEALDGEAICDTIGPGKALQLGYYPVTQSVLPFTMAIQVLSVFMPEAWGLDPNRDSNDNYTEFVHTRVL